MMKFGRKIFFTRGLYKCPGTFVGPFWDLLNSFHVILIIIFRFLVLISFGIFRAKMMKCGRQIFFTRRLYNTLGTFLRPFRDLPDNFYEILFKIFRPLALIIFNIFRAKMIKYGRKHFSPERSIAAPVPS